jgi:uncharacterized protein (TIGR02147 family)
MKDEIPLVFGYTNYRKYLGDFYNARKNSARGYSYRQFGIKAGFSSPNALKNVIEGERNLTPQSVEQFLVALGLDGDEANYFRYLVLMNQAEHDVDKEKFFAKLQEYIPNSRRYELEGDAMEYIQHWLFPVIREMIGADDFRDDPYWIKRRLRSNADLKDIASALTFLKRNGFIFKDENGKFAVKDDVILSSDEVRSMAIRGYYRRVIEQSIAMMEEVPVKEREYGALIFNLPEEDVPELKEKLKTFLNDLHKWTLKKSQKDGVVIQYLFQMYPQTRSNLDTSGSSK